MSYILSRIHMEEFSCDLLKDIDIKDDAFKEPLYLDLLITVEKYKEFLPDLME